MIHIEPFQNPKIRCNLKSISGHSIWRTIRDPPKKFDFQREITCLIQNSRNKIGNRTQHSIADVCLSSISEFFLISIVLQDPLGVLYTLHQSNLVFRVKLLTWSRIYPKTKFEFESITDGRRLFIFF